MKMITCDMCQGSLEKRDKINKNLWSRIFPKNANKYGKTVVANFKKSNTYSESVKSFG